MEMQDITAVDSNTEVQKCWQIKLIAIVGFSQMEHQFFSASTLYVLT